MAMVLTGFVQYKGNKKAEYIGYNSATGKQTIYRHKCLMIL